LQEYQNIIYASSFNKGSNIFWGIYFRSLYVTTLPLYNHQASGVCVDLLQNSGPKIIFDLMCQYAAESCFDGG
jgi:hypothetical protein